MFIFNWLKQNFKGVVVFVTILAMGAGILPTVHYGTVFVESIKFEKMAEASPAYAVVRDIEAQTSYYVLSVARSNGILVVWILADENENYEDTEVDLYAMFSSVREHYGEQDCIILEAEETTLPSMNGPVIGFQAWGFYSMTAEAIQALAESDIENVDDTLTALYSGDGFDASPVGTDNDVYMTVLLARSPYHIAPWEKE